MGAFFRSRPALILVIALVLGGATGAIAWVRLSRVTLESNPTEYWRRQGQAVYATMPSVPVQDAKGVGRVFEECPVEDRAGLLDARPDLVAALRATVAEFVVARYSAASSDEYVRWMETKGYRFKSLEDFERVYGPIGRRAEAAGVVSTDPRELFRAMWAYSPSREATPNGMCTDPRAVVMVIGKSNSNRAFTELLAGALGEELWYGGQIASCRFWMSAPVTREDLVRSKGAAIAAQVGIIGCVPGADRRPVHIALYLDAELERWWIDGVAVGNHADPSGGWDCCEY